MRRIQRGKTPQIDPDYHAGSNCTTVGRHPVPLQHRSTQRRLGSETIIWKSVSDATMRRCVDYKLTINQVSKLDAYLLPRAEAEKPLPFKVNLVHNTQEVSLIGGRVPYIKELTEQEVFTRKLFGLSNPMITNGGSEMGMNEDTQVSMDTSDGDGGELAAASEIPERADEERTEVNTSQQCGMAAAVEEGEECQEVKMSDLEGSVDELKLNIVVCVKKEACDDPAAVVEGGRSEPSGSEEPLALGAESPPSPRAHGQHKAHVPGEETEDYLKPLERLHQEQVQSTDSYRVTSNLFQQTLTEFKTDIRQNLQRNKEILQQQNEVLRQQNEIRNQHLQRNNEILQQQNEVLRQQNEALCQLLQRSNETLNEMSKILSRTVVPAPSGQTQPSAETSAAGHPSGTGEITPWGLGRHRRN
ncbi:hypothetical protein scyTo_0009559 [Scyliorhinus torazame]|uniref:Uncharacterized protein n=1 Tax=Scyliorhinus torazame TaxID=75743 RepID=A0A401NP63_SCYTO|nr:hypothetical protein [Scyliorhinus torazame]